ncbi:MAG: hypothetical protein H0T62_00025 [Parachlamydiaceae bacterium]|nr:hypothetical protein [Parachlamydiaceae bacterium]
MRDAAGHSSLLSFDADDALCLEALTEKVNSDRLLSKKVILPDHGVN